MRAQSTCMLGACVAFVHLLPAQPSDTPSPALAWGPPVSGLRLSLRLDNDIHKLGDDVRLHIAMENFAASESVHGPSPTTRCNSRVRIEVRDRIDGLLVTERRSSSPRICVGKAAPPTEYALGSITPEQRTLGDLGWLPNYAGSFTVSAIWTVYACNPCDWNRVKPHAVVKSEPQHLLITDKEAPPHAPNPSPVLLSGRLADQFEQVDSNLGEKSALKDKRTGLLWLHLNVTRGMSYLAVQSELVPGGRFDGWRYATLEELREFFSLFTGTPSGVSRDPALQQQLQRHLGGPLHTFADASIGWRRTSSLGIVAARFDLGHATAGYIANDSQSGPVIDAQLQGSTTDSGGSPYIGSYLVRRDENPPAPLRFTP